MLGTLLGGWVGDRVGRIPVMWFSILGALPFALMLPHANLFWTGVLAVTVAMIMASAFPAILVYAQELLPGRVGLVAGMFFGFSFGLGGLGAAALGKLADLTSIETVYQVTPFLLCLGLLTAFLPTHPGRPDAPALTSRRRPWTPTPTRSAVRSTASRSRPRCSPTSCCAPPTASRCATGT